MALSDALGKPNPLVYLSDSEALMTNIDKWIGESTARAAVRAQARARAGSRGARRRKRVPCPPARVVQLVAAGLTPCSLHKS